jgi:two-component system, response regulator RegA
MRVLLVEDDLPLRDAIRAAASTWSVVIRQGASSSEVRLSEIFVAASVKEAVALLDQRPALLIVDVRLNDESGLDVVRHAMRLESAPLVLAVSGQATAAEAFSLAALGVRGYLGKPFDLHELRAAVEGVFLEPPDLQPGAMAQVGHRPIHAVQDTVKVAMLKRALQLEEGNITRAAKRLGITRTAVQQMIDRYGLPRPRGV